MMSSSFRGGSPFCALLAAAVFAGCVKSDYQVVPVTGKVVCNGAPAWGGSIVFHPVDAPERTGRPQGTPGRASAGIIQEDGSFQLMMRASAMGSEQQGALTGPHRVSFLLPKSTPWEWNPEDNWLPPEEQQKLKKELAERPVYPKLPCGDQITPGEVEVTAGGKNFFEFVLTHK